MLTEEKNRLLTRVGPGTPMGQLLRRYWMPIDGVSEFDAKPVKAVRLMGEDLVLFRDLGGSFGLIDRYCAHRGTDHTKMRPCDARAAFIACIDQRRNRWHWRDRHRRSTAMLRDCQR